jgi:putative tricarboxylic transport membrane protein
MSLGRDGIAGLILLGLSLVLFSNSFTLPYLPIVPVGPGFYPRIVLGFLALASLMLVAQDWLKRRRTAVVTRASGDRRNYQLVAALFAAVGAYVWLLPLLGFRLATALFIGAAQIILDFPLTARAWMVVSVVALATTLTTYAVFNSYLLVLLPRGTLTGW